jgi:hypothetical protein
VVVADEAIGLVTAEHERTHTVHDLALVRARVAGCQWHLEASRVHQYHEFRDFSGFLDGDAVSAALYFAERCGWAVAWNRQL